MVSMSTDCAELRHWLGAYVLGALDPGDRAAVEAHLAGCPGCREELAELAGLPGLLGRLSLAEAEAAGSTPLADPGPLERAIAELISRRHRLRRRRLATAAGAAVLIAGVAVGATVAGFPGDQRSPGTTTTGTTATATDSGTGVQAAATVLATPWGTSIRLTIAGVQPGERCQLIAVAQDGDRAIAGGWQITYTGQADITGATAIPRENLTALQVVTTDGAVLVTLPVPR